MFRAPEVTNVYVVFNMMSQAYPLRIEWLKPSLSYSQHNTSTDNCYLRDRCSEVNISIKSNIVVFANMCARAYIVKGIVKIYRISKKYSINK